MHGFAAIAQQRDKANFMTNPAVPASNTVPEMGATQPQHYGSGGGMYGGYMGPQGGGNHGGINVTGMPGQFNSHRVSNKVSTGSTVYVAYGLHTNHTVHTVSALSYIY